MANYQRWMFSINGRSEFLMDHNIGQRERVVKPDHGREEPKRWGLADLHPSKILGRLKVNEGYLLFYYIDKSFSLNAILLDKKAPDQIIWRSSEPIWQTNEKIQPLKVTIDKRIVTFHFKVQNKLQTTTFPLAQLFALKPQKKSAPTLLHRIPTNPILQPTPENQWESRYVLNSAALYLGGKVHFLYRAIGDSGLSVLGYATSRDGVHIDERSNEPAYICSGSLTSKKDKQILSPYAYASGGSWSGCEDPRLTKIDDTIYMTYTAFSDWGSPPGIALTSISVTDFLQKCWNWQMPVLISPPNEMHKNWVIFPGKIKGKLAVLHSISPNILIEYCDSLDFGNSVYINSHYQASGREGHWDNWVRGVGPPPIKTSDGWLVLYHAMDKNDPNRYKLGAMVLDQDDPTNILYRSSSPLLQPDAQYENEGYKAGVVYSCGAVIVGERLLVYYGGADTVVCAAFINLNELIDQLKNAKPLALEQTPPLTSQSQEDSYV